MEGKTYQNEHQEEKKVVWIPVVSEKRPIIEWLALIYSIKRNEVYDKDHNTIVDLFYRHLYIIQILLLFHLLKLEQTFEKIAKDETVMFLRILSVGKMISNE